MKIVCISTRGTERNPFYDDIVDGYPLNKPTLTLGKIYEVDNFNHPHIRVIRDDGKEQVFQSDRFISLKEHRKRQLEKIGI